MRRLSSTRELGERAAALGHLGDAEADDLLGRRLGDVVAVERDRALARDRARDRPHRRRLAGPVGAEDDDDLALARPSRSSSCSTLTGP